MATRAAKRADALTHGTEVDWRADVRRAAETDSVEEIVRLTHSPHPAVRVAALRALCPCRVKDEIDAFWDRACEMVTDEDASVRAQVLHTLCDGAPTHVAMEARVADALEVFNHDADPDIRRRAHKVLAHFRKTGRWNIL